MYQKPQHTRPTTRLSFLHGITKETINKIFLENKLFGWEYKPLNTDAPTILNWLADVEILKVDGKATTITQLQSKFEEAKVGTVFNVAALASVESSRSDAPPVVEAIVNLKVIEGGLRLISEYNREKAIRPISQKEAEDIVVKLLIDVKHNIHQFIQHHSKQHPTTSAKVFKETLANWDKVF